MHVQRLASAARISCSTWPWALCHYHRHRFTPQTWTSQSRCGYASSSSSSAIEKLPKPSKKQLKEAALQQQQQQEEEGEKGAATTTVSQTKEQVKALARLVRRLDKNGVLKYVSGSGSEEEPLEYERVQGGGFYQQGLSKLRLGRYYMWLKIGFGKTSSVWLASDPREKRIVAIKILSGHQTELNDLGVWQELEAHMRIGGKAKARKNNCITLLDSFRVPAFWESDGEHLCLVLPLMRANLDDVINPRGEPAPVIPMDVVKKVLRSVLKAINHLHQNNIVHREITTRDVMITVDPQFDVGGWTLLKNHNAFPSTKVVPGEEHEKHHGMGSLYSVHLPKPTMEELASEKAEFVLSDLGTARLVDQLPLLDAYTPLTLRPPEVLLGGDWDKSIDIWNFGTMAYYLLTHKPLFSLTLPEVQKSVSKHSTLLQPPEIKKDKETTSQSKSKSKSKIDASLEEWLLYQMSSVCESDLPVGSLPKVLMKSWGNLDIPGTHQKTRCPFDKQGRLRAFTPSPGVKNKYVKLKRRSFFDLLESTPVPMALEEREDAANFLGRCVCLDPKERASAAQLLRHPFLEAYEYQGEEEEETTTTTTATTTTTTTTTTATCTLNLQSASPTVTVHVL